jgi:hypothetical protein
VSRAVLALGLALVFVNFLASPGGKSIRTAMWGTVTG